MKRSENSILLESCRWILLGAWCVLFGLISAGFVRADDPGLPGIELKPTDRILVLAPHPDDEVLGCGGIIQQALHLNLPVRVVFLTNGDNNQWSFLIYRKHPVIFSGAAESMGRVRQAEAVAAAGALGLGAQQLTFLGYPDFGTMSIWYTHWNDRPPFRSFLTRTAAVPYKNVFRPGAPYKGEEILRDLDRILQDFQPTKLFVSHPADHNGDHLAFYLFSRVALWETGMENTVEVYPYLIHHKGWPKSHGYKPRLALSPPEVFNEEIRWFSSPLSSDAIDRKYAALKKHRSQYQSSARYLLSFVRANELFGDFSPIRFSAKVGSSDVYRPDSPDTRQGQPMPEELTDVERAAFVGVEWRYVSLEKDRLVLSFALSKPLAQGVGASIYIFGYRKDRSFGAMPKVHIKLGVSRYTVYDQTKKLPSDSIEVERKASDLIVKVPWALLGDPQKILTSARTYLGSVPLDWVSWRTVEILP